MKITFIGANHEVTGSCTMIECGGKRMLIDCGMEQGINTFENVPLPAAPGEIDYVFVTHAHIDHTGNLPLLYKNGFRGPVYATKETCNLCDIMLRDCAHIQMSEAEYQTRKSRRAGGDDVPPLYDLSDAAGLVALMRPCDYGRVIQIDEHVFVRFTDIGHLLGSACIELWLQEDGTKKKIVFSGDVGNTNQPIINDPKPVAEADYLVIESTYGDRLHDAPKNEHITALAEYIQKTLDRGGNIIIPSFAVGRTQEILYFIREIKNSGMVTGHDGFPVYVDSPLANEATSVFIQCDMSCLDPETTAIMEKGDNPIVFDGLHNYVSTEQSKALNSDPTPKIIISASGMCDAGRVRHHLKYNLWNRKNLILFVGYQARGTLGRSIVDGAKSVKLFGDDIAVNAEIAALPGVSGHADKNGLLRWVSQFEKKPEQIFVNHGEDSSCREFTRCLSEDMGLNAFAPYSGTEYDLAAGKFITVTDGVPVSKKAAAKARKKTCFDALMAAVQRLMGIAKKSEGRTNKDLGRFTGEINSLCDKWEK